jgi:hypothetical protein
LAKGSGGLHDNYGSALAAQPGFVHQQQSNNERRRGQGQGQQSRAGRMAPGLARRAVHDLSPWSESDLPALERAVAGEEVEYTVGLPGEGVETEVFFSDLSHDYVTINAEYTT